MNIKNSGDWVSNLGERVYGDMHKTDGDLDRAVARLQADPARTPAEATAQREEVERLSDKAKHRNLMGLVMAAIERMQDHGVKTALESLGKG